MTVIFRRFAANVLDRVQRRFRVARPGSVLILVVALLVLMALIGTAYIATARTDRYTSAQHTKNVQIDMLVEAVLNMVVPLVQDDLSDQTPLLPAFRPPDTGANAPSGYDHWDAPGFYTPVDTPPSSRRNKMPDDAWLAPRDARSQQVGNWPNFEPYMQHNGLDVIALWDGVSYPPLHNGPMAAPNYPWQFDTPAPTPAIPLLLSLPFKPDPTPFGTFTFQPNEYPVCYASKPWIEPTFKEFPTGSGNIYPAFIPRWWMKDPGTGVTHTPVFTSGPEMIGGDADGDGMTDCGLWLIPDARVDGITYYGGIRIIDNNSAVNVNTAWTNRDFNGDTTVAPMGTALAGTNYPRYFTPASIGFNEMLRTYRPPAPANWTVQGDEILAVDLQRFNKTTPAQLFDPAAPPRPYNYPRMSEYLYTQLGARMGNPGTVAGTTNFQAFSTSDQTSVGFHQALINPDATPSSLEGLFFNSSTADTLYHAAWNFNSRQVSYPSNKSKGTNPWFQTTWDFARENIALPLQPLPNLTFLQKRGLLVTSNPVSNTAPVHEIVLPSPLNPAAHFATLYAANAGIQPFSPAVSITYSPQRVSINQAPFPDLWRAYWNVMTELTILPPEVTPAPGTLNWVVYGSPFDLRVWYAAMYEADLLATRVPPINNATAAAQRVRIPTPYQQHVIDPPTFNSPSMGQTFDEYYEAATNTLVTGAVVTPADSFKPNVHPGNAAFTPVPYDPRQPVDAPFAILPAGQSFTDYNPARMFRSTMRSIPDPNVNVGDAARPEFIGYDNNTPRMNAQQMMLLRAAITSVNAEALRDSDADVNAERVVLKVSRQIFNGQNALVPVDAVVYGMERQPFITEVYAETEGSDHDGAGLGLENPYGYVAIKLYNPYDQDIPLTNWKLAAIDRRSVEKSPGALGVLPPYRDVTVTHGAPGVAATFTSPGGIPTCNFPLDETTLIADFDPDPDLHVDVLRYPQDVILPRDAAGTPQVFSSTDPLIVPAHGYLLLENYFDPATYGPLTAPAPPNHAQHRPFATGLSQTGNLVVTMSFNPGNSRSLAQGGVNNRQGAGLPQVNVACVPGLSGMLDIAWGPVNAPEWGTGVRSVFNRELVLLRPRRADGQYSVGAYKEIKTLTEGTYPPLAYDERPNLAAAVGDFPAVIPLVEVRYSHLRDLVPVDSFDFTGLMMPIDAAAAPPFVRPEPLGRPPADPIPGPEPYNPNVSMAWHYARQTHDLNNGAPTWTCVYPGRYDANPGTISVPPAALQLGDQRPRQQGVEYTGWALGTPNANPWRAGGANVPPGTPAAPSLPTTPINLGRDRTNAAANTLGTTDTYFASFPTSFRIPLGITNVNTTVMQSSAIGPSPLPAGAAIPGVGGAWFELPPPAPPPQATLPTQNFPFGGFARNGDILAVPHIGAYRITYSMEQDPGVPAANVPDYGALFTVAELNSVTMDAVFAEDADTLDDPLCIRPPSAGNATPLSNQPYDDAPPVPTLTIPPTPPGTAGLAEREQVGRFVPIRVYRELRPPGENPPNYAAPGPERPDYFLDKSVNPPVNKPQYQLTLNGAGVLVPNGVMVNDYAQDPSFQVANPFSGEPQRGLNWEPFWRYRWGADLFDYITTSSPADDYQPNYPVQDRWKARITPPVGVVWPAVPDTRYYQGDIASLFLTDGSHIIMRYEGPGPYDDPRTDAVGPDFSANNWLVLWRSAPLQNGTDPAAFSSGTNVQQHTEDNVPIEGLININTAGWRVLATLPLVVNPGPPLVGGGQPGTPDDFIVPGSAPARTYRQLNTELAKAIAYWRDVDANPDPNIYAPHGPFRSIYELQRVVDLRPSAVTVPTVPLGYPAGTFGGVPYTLPGFANGYGTTPLPNTTTPTLNTGTQPDDPLGDLAPNNGPTTPPDQLTDDVRSDYKERFCNLTRISNLVTTRSDSFTVYILVEGWENAGSTDPVNYPKRVIQKRAAYIIDRSRAIKKTPTVTKVPFANN